MNDNKGSKQKETNKVCWNKSVSKFVFHIKTMTLDLDLWRMTELGMSMSARFHKLGQMPK